MNISKGCDTNFQKICSRQGFQIWPRPIFAARDVSNLGSVKVQELSGAVDFFMENMSALASKSTYEVLGNAKLTNLLSTQPLVGSPKLPQTFKNEDFLSPTRQGYV